MRLARRTWASVILIIPIGEGEVVIATSLLESLMHSPRLKFLGLPLDSPSKFSFQYPTFGGLQVTFLQDKGEIVLLIFQQFGININFHF